MKNTVNKKLFSLRFNIKSFLIFILIFCVEVVIALFINDSFIRPYLGDILVVILLYYFAKTFLNTKHIYIVITVLLFAYLVEFAQYLQLVEILGLQDNKFMRTIIGSVFSWGDMACYTIGALICYLIDRPKKIDRHASS